MSPNGIIQKLAQISSEICERQSPSKHHIANQLYRILISTDKTLSLKIRNIVVEEITRLMPDEFNGELHDTNPGGKGFLSGYISFALDPQSWESNGIIGGILFKLKYDKDDFRSEEPETGYKADQSHSKGDHPLIISTEAGYYNKKIDGSYSEGRSLGDILLHIDAKEKVLGISIEDSSQFKNGIIDLINSILQNPPEYAQSFQRKQKQIKEKFAPTTNVKALHKWLLDNSQEGVVFGSQLNNLAQGRSAEKRTTFQDELRKVIEYFTSRGWKIDHKR